MDSDKNNQEVFYCENDGEYRLYCKFFDKVCKERFYRNHLKSGRHITNIRKKQHSNN